MAARSQNKPQPCSGRPIALTHYFWSFQTPPIRARTWINHLGYTTSTACETPNTSHIALELLIFRQAPGSLSDCIVWDVVIGALRSARPFISPELRRLLATELSRSWQGPPLLGRPASSSFDRWFCRRSCWVWWLVSGLLGKPVIAWLRPGATVARAACIARPRRSAASCNPGCDAAGAIARHFCGTPTRPARPLACIFSYLKHPFER